MPRKDETAARRTSVDLDHICNELIYLQYVVTANSLPRRDSIYCIAFQNAILWNVKTNVFLDVRVTYGLRMKRVSNNRKRKSSPGNHHAGQTISSCSHKLNELYMGSSPHLLLRA
jgi:hypothetical protein